MDYITNSENGQLLFSQSVDFLKIPSRLTGFTNEDTTVETARSGREVFCFRGHMDISEDERKLMDERFAGLRKFFQGRAVRQFWDRYVTG